MQEFSFLFTILFLVWAFVNAFRYMSCREENEEERLKMLLISLACFFICLPFFAYSH